MNPLSRFFPGDRLERLCSEMTDSTRKEIQELIDTSKLSGDFTTLEQIALNACDYPDGPEIEAMATRTTHNGRNLFAIPVLSKEGGSPDIKRLLLNLDPGVSWTYAPWGDIPLMLSDHHEWLGSWRSVGVPNVSLSAKQGYVLVGAGSAWPSAQQADSVRKSIQALGQQYDIRAGKLSSVWTARALAAAMEATVPLWDTLTVLKVSGERISDCALKTAHKFGKAGLRLVGPEKTIHYLKAIPLKPGLRPRDVRLEALASYIHFAQDEPPDLSRANPHAVDFAVRALTSTLVMNQETGCRMVKSLRRQEKHADIKAIGEKLETMGYNLFDLVPEVFN